MAEIGFAAIETVVRALKALMNREGKRRRDER
jgi:hypothetical protein